MPLIDLPADAQLDTAPGGKLAELPPGAQLDQPQIPGFFQTGAQVAGGLANDLSAAMQGTSPLVRDMSGKSNYQTLGPYVNSDAGPMYADQQGQWHPVDATRHVILTDPATGKPTVFLRSENTDESALTSLGRMLGFGAAAPSTIAAPTLTTPVTTAVANRFGGQDTKALAQLGNALQADIKAGGPGPAQILEGLTNAGAPATVADVAGENLRGLAGQVARMPGPGRQQLVSALDLRDADSGPRLAQTVNDMTGGGGEGNFLTAQALQNQARQAAAPFYGQAYLAPPLNPDLMAEGGALKNLMARPSMRDAAGRALSIAAEEGRNPNSLGLSLNEAGDPVFTSVPSWQTLDYVKRGLDDVLNGYRDSTTGRLMLDERGRAIDQTRRNFLDLIDRENPAFAQARAVYSGPQQSRGALMQGAQALNRDPDQIASDLSQLSPGDQQFYRLGAANALKTALAKTSSGGNEARQIVGNNYRQAQLRAIFPNADNLIAAAQNESKMFGTRQALLGGSQTASRLAQDQGTGEGFLRPAVEALTAIATHEPMLAAKSGLSAMGNIFKGSGKLTPETASKVAGYLLQSDPAAARAWLMDAFSRVNPVQAAFRPTVPLVDATALQGPNAR